VGAPRTTREPEKLGITSLNEDESWAKKFRPTFFDLPENQS